MRKLCYARFSEGRAAHWQLLMAADRVDAARAHLRSALTLHPDNPITQTGIKAGLTHHGASSRLGRNRTDIKHQAFDPLIGAGPFVAAAGAGIAAAGAGIAPAKALAGALCG